MSRQTRLSTVALLIIGFYAQTQQPFKYDNTVYKAVYLNEAFRLMNTEKTYLLLDVRTPGEYADTSRHTWLNIGRMKGSLNISIDSVPAHLEELKKYSNEPIFVYCSHSRRSREVSKLLGENGFQQVYNINGGMSLLNEMDSKRFPYKEKVLEVNTPYKNIASADAIDLIKKESDLVIIDIRTDAEFNSKDTIPGNNIGRFKKAINIPQKDFAEKFDSYHMPKNKPVLLYDLDGTNSMDVAGILLGKGFTRIYNLYEGFDAFVYNHELTNDLREKLLTGLPSYQLVDPEQGIDLLTQHPDMIVVDTRPQEEFENKAKMSFHNIGQMKGAINVFSQEALDRLIQQTKKTAPVLVYCGMSDDFAIKACNELMKNGFKNVSYLGQGLYRFVWATANIEDCQRGKVFLVNHDQLY